MKINTRSKTGKSVNYKAFNATLIETPQGLKVVGAFGANNVEADSDQWQRLDSRSFARALKGNKLVTK